MNINLVEAQQARRVLDRLVGYKISPLLWDKVRRGLSAGRVQTVALRLIVEREREIRAFEKQEYWTIDANLAAKKPPRSDGALHQAERRSARRFRNEEAAQSRCWTRSGRRDVHRPFGRRRARSGGTRWRRSSRRPCSRSRRASCGSA